MGPAYDETQIRTSRSLTNISYATERPKSCTTSVANTTTHIHELSLSTVSYGHVTCITSEAINTCGDAVLLIATLDSLVENSSKLDGPIIMRACTMQAECGNVHR